MGVPSDAQIGRLLDELDSRKVADDLESQWLDFAEDQTLQRKEIFLKDWETKLDKFLRFTERQVLTNAGTVSHDQAVEKAETEYELFAARRREWLEAEGQREAVQALETVARQLGPTVKPKRSKKDA